MKQLLLGGLLATISVACATPQAPPVEAASLPPASSTASSTAPEAKSPEPDVVSVRVQDGVVSIRGEQLDTPVPGELKRLDGLFRVMRGLSSEGAPEPFDVAVSGALDAARFKSLIQTAAYAGWPLAVLETARGDVAIHSLTPTAPDASASLFPASMIVLVVRMSAVEVWLTQKSGEARAAAPERLDDGRSLVEILGEECPKTPCNPASLLLSARFTPWRSPVSAS